MKQIQSNEPQRHDVLWKLPEVKVKHCGLLPLTQFEASACDQENFLENSVGHDR